MISVMILGWLLKSHQGDKKMQIRNYGLYDTVAKNMVSIFQSQNDDVCTRSVIKMVQDPHSDIELLKDCNTS